LAGRPSKVEVFRTVEKKKTLTPEWNQTFEFGKWVVMEMSMMMIIWMMLCHDDRVMLKIFVMMMMMMMMTVMMS